MSQKIKQDDGTEVEFFSAEELAEQANSKAKELAETAIAEERDRLEGEKEAALLEQDTKFAAEREELDKLRKKDLNFENLRKSKILSPEQEAEQKKNADILKKLQEKVDAIEIQPLEMARSNFVESNFAADDKDGRELFDFYYKKLATGAKTMDDVNKAVVAAFAATTQGQRRPNIAGSMRTSVSENYGADIGDQESEASREFGNLLGISAEDKKKFGSSVKSASVNLFAKNKKG